jgi:predicted unusual protein kinase regulating ubiquinone biosynthesis (AarF/ABC1/UbiB family)
LLRLPALVAGAVLLPFRRRRTAQGVSGDAGTRKDEMLSLAAGVTRTIGGARVRSVFRGKQAKEEAQRAALEKATAEAVEQLGNMKGLAMKLGQMMSYLSLLPEDGEEQLAALQDAVPPMDHDLVAAVVSDQLGAQPEQVFAAFDYEPIAAASVGQVHRARLHDGRAVAVKLQYPGVDEAFEADLDNIDDMSQMASLTMKADVGEYLGILSDSFRNELDYCAEQRNQQRLADLYRGHPFVVIPETVPELCRPRVLVTEFIEGHRFRDVVTRTQEERNRRGEVMYRFAFGCIVNGFFSGDPHPGNYLFLDDGRVCFLDFGMVMDIGADADGNLIRQLFEGALQADQPQVDAALRQIGFLPDGGPSGEEVWGEIQPLIAGPIDALGATRFDRKAFQRAMQRQADLRTPFNRAAMKTDHFEGWAAIWMRYATGALAAIARLEPEADWRQIVSEIVLGAPPRNDIGERWGPSPGGSAFTSSRSR